jgi:hypothetical protein
LDNKDVTKAIEPKSDQLNVDSLITGPRTIRIRDVAVNSTAEQPIWVYFDGDDGKPWKPCKTSSRCLASIWGANAAQWVGMSCTIYNDPSVTWGGAAVGGIRVSHMEGIDAPRTLQLTKTRGKKSAVTIQPLRVSSVKTTEPVQDFKDDARSAARQGKDAFNAWWKANPDKRDNVKPIMDELKSLVEKASVATDEAPM